MDISETLRLLPNLAGSQADESFVFKNLDPRVTIGIPKSYEIGPLAVVLPIDEFWSTRTEAANRAFQAIIGRTTSPMIPRHRSRRIRSALRANDGRAIGATYKQIAKELFGSQRVDAEHWKTSALKAQVARLCQYGRELVAADYRSLLRGKAKNSYLPNAIRRQTSSK